MVIKSNVHTNLLLNIRGIPNGSLIKFRSIPPRICQTEPAFAKDYLDGFICSVSGAFFEIQCEMEYKTIKETGSFYVFKHLAMSIIQDIYTLIRQIKWRHM